MEYLARSCGERDESRECIGPTAAPAPGSKNFIAEHCQSQRERMDAQRLEGSQTSPRRSDSGRLRRASRFGAYPATLATFGSSRVRPKRVKTSGSRERLIGSQLYGLDIDESRANGRCIALGNSREPLVATFFGRMKRSNEYSEVVRYAPKRLARRSLPESERRGEVWLSRRWAATAR
jgi:hypothetical protein